MPFNSIEGLGQIKLGKEGFVFPRLEVEGVDNVLGYDDIRSNVSTLNKGSLSWVNDMGEVMFDAINQSFSNNFGADIA